MPITTVQNTAKVSVVGKNPSGIGADAHRFEPNRAAAQIDHLQRIRRQLHRARAQLPAHDLERDASVAQ